MEIKRINVGFSHTINLVKYGGIEHLLLHITSTNTDVCNNLDLCMGYVFLNSDERFVFAKIT